MAKNFHYNTTNYDITCTDKCTCSTGKEPNYLHESVYIGSIYCKTKCKHSQTTNPNNNPNTITCPKIIYRHYSGLVVMRHH